MGNSIAWSSNLEENIEGMNPACQAKVNNVPLSTSLELSLRYDFMNKFEQLINFVSDPVRTTGKPYDLTQLEKELAQRQLVAGYTLVDSFVSDEIDGAHAVLIVGYDYCTSFF